MRVYIHIIWRWLSAWCLCKTRLSLSWIIRVRRIHVSENKSRLVKTAVNINHIRGHKPFIESTHIQCYADNLLMTITRLPSHNNAMIHIGVWTVNRIYYTRAPMFRIRWAIPARAQQMFTAHQTETRKLWGSPPPHSSRASLKTSVLSSRLRYICGPIASASRYKANQITNLAGRECDRGPFPFTRHRFNFASSSMFCGLSICDWQHKIK